MATKITVVGKVITIPKTPYLVQTDNAVEHFQFDIDESSVVLADKSFYLLFKTSRNSASMQPLPDVSVDPVTGHVLIDWVPDSEFTAVNGYTDIQLKAMSGQTLIWNTTKATVYVYNELLNTAAAQVNPKTPTLFLYYLHVMQGLRTEVEKIYDTFMNDPTIEVDPNVGTPSAEISVEGTGEDKHYHFSFHNLKGETGGGEVNDVMTSKDGTNYTSVVDPADKKARISFKDIKHVYHQATEPTDAEVGDVWTTDEEGGGGGTWGTITGDIQDQTDLQTEFASKQNKIYHQNTEPSTAVEGDVWTSDEEGGGAVADVAFVDDMTIERNASGQLQVKDKGVTLAKLADQPSDIGKIYAIHDDGTTILKTFKEMFLNMMYPVASRYIQLQGMPDPNTFGGTWEVDTDYNGRSIWCDSTQALGSTVAQALPKPTLACDTKGSHSHSIISDGSHYHSRGSMNIKGSAVLKIPANANFLSVDVINTSGAISASESSQKRYYYDANVSANFGKLGQLNFDASNNWTGYTSTTGSHAHGMYNNGSHNHSVTVTTAGVYGDGTKVQPDAITCIVWKRTA